MRHRLKVSFLTDSNFFNHRREILSGLNKQIHLKLIVIYVGGQVGDSLEEIESFCENEKINASIVLKSKYRARDPRRLFYDFKYIIREILRAQSDAIYIETFGSPFVALMCAYLLRRKKTVIGIHDFKLHQITQHQTPFSARVYQKIAFTHFRHFHFFSYSQAALFQKRHRKKKTHVIRLFKISVPKRITSERKVRQTTDFLFFGRIFYYKGVDLLIRAAEILWEKRKDFKVIIAGHIDQPNEIHDMISSNELFELHLDYVQPDEISNLFNNCDYFIAPYRSVTQSGPLMVAFNYGVIPITSDEPGFTEYLTHKQTGLTFKSGDIQDLVTIMEEAIKLTQEERQKMLSKLDSFKAQEFNIATVVGKYISMFNQVAD